MTDGQDPRPLEKSFFAYVLIGLMVGITASLFGLGGGLVVIPLLLLLTGEPPKNAVKISLGVMTITSLASMLPHLGALDWPVGITIGVGTTIAGMFGATLLPYVPDWVIRKLINVVLFAAGIHMFLFGITY